MPMIKQKLSSEGDYSKQNEYNFRVDGERILRFSSLFQNGNIRLIKQINQFYYIFQPVPDCQNINSKKSWFYFKIKCTKGIKIRLIIENVSIFQNIFEEKNHYKPFYRSGQEGRWEQITQSFLTFRDDVALVIDFNFKDDNWVYICMTIPYTYTDHLIFLKDKINHLHSSISYSDEILTLTPMKREVHLLTISQNNSQQYKGDDNKKPVVLISSRVHPGEVSSSYCIEGIIQYLTEQSNLQAYLLRRLFVFKIIPMVNPDGVACGNYRMDPQGFNLNRFYRCASKYSAVYQIAQIMKKNPVEYYFDLHSHSNIKPSFIYGNAFEDIVNQTYSELFCRLLEQNYSQFSYGFSSFQQRHMKHKDKGENLSKEGCGRVVMKNYGVTRSYTVQSSIFPSSYESKPPKTQSINKTFAYKSKQGMAYQLQQCQQPKQGENILVSQNKKLGKAMLVTILDMSKKNPFTRVNQYLQHSFCKQISQKIFQNEERFKLLDQRAYQKVKNINQLIRFQFQDKIDRLWNYCGVANSLNSINWPQQVKRIVIFKQSLQKAMKPKRENLRLKTQDTKLGLGVQTNKQSMNLMFEQLETEYEPKNYTSKSKQKKTMLPQLKSSAKIEQNRQKTIIQKVKRSHEKSSSTRDIKLSINNLIQHQKTQTNIKDVQVRMFYLNQHQHRQKIINRHHASMNRMINDNLKMKDSDKDKKKRYDGVDHNRKRVLTECKQQKNVELLIENVLSKERNTHNQDQNSKIRTFRYDVIQKKLLPNNHALQLKKNSKLKIKLPDVKHLNLVISNKQFANKQEEGNNDIDLL